ncbi:hypothetical protein JTE90_026148 [Oedothorax gibbosus]|uniref:Uncharacterized protein n=1 Tax=Oedothorax gibbosus TaxID=931172 RepID=A0AAV6V014_9ARAC|nr:hypothetical protein JTE90_026148 [Oedothorax gibbosus]
MDECGIFPFFPGAYPGKKSGEQEGCCHGDILLCSPSAFQSAQCLSGKEPAKEQDRDTKDGEEVLGC